MPDRPSRRPATLRRGKRDDRDSGPGVIARLADHAIDNPATSGGLLLMTLTAAAIISNAMFLQSGRHPQPLFMTRPALTAETPHAAAPPVPLPRIRAEAPRPVPREAPPVPREAPAVALAPAPAPSAGNSLVMDLQRALTQRGLYQGSIDGLAGKRTRAAISAYQLVEGIAVTGEPSAAILARLKTAKPIPAAEPSPAPAAPQPAAVAPAPQPAAAAAAPVAPPPPAPVAVVAAPVPAPSAPPAPLPAETAVAAPAPAPVPSATPAPLPAPPALDPAAAQREQYMSVQKALNEIGYGPVPVTGTVGDETAGAISRFELDNGLPITGKLGDQLISRLVSIGAMKPL